MPDDIAFFFPSWKTLLCVSPLTPHPSCPNLPVCYIGNNQHPITACSGGNSQWEVTQKWRKPSAVSGFAKHTEKNSVTSSTLLTAGISWEAIWKTLKSTLQLHACLVFSPKLNQIKHWTEQIDFFFAFVEVFKAQPKGFLVGFFFKSWNWMIRTQGWERAAGDGTLPSPA